MKSVAISVLDAAGIVIVVPEDGKTSPPLPDAGMFRENVVPSLTNETVPPCVETTNGPATVIVALLALGMPVPPDAGSNDPFAPKDALNELMQRYQS